MWGNLEILESYVGERVNKIRFVGSINKENRLRENSVRTFQNFEKREKNQRRREEQEGCDFLYFKVRVSLAIQLY